MLSKQFTLSWVFTFLAMMVYGFSVYGVLLNDFFQANMGDIVWRPVGTEKMEWLVFGNILMSYAMVRIFAHGYENKGIGEGVRFGIIMGVFWGSIEFLNYAFMPGTFNAMWVGFFGNVGLFAFAGAVLAKTYSSTA